MLKDFFRNAVLAAVLAISLAQASAQSYPVKPIRLIVPYPPGGGTDIFARILGTRLGEALGQLVVIDNRAGAAGVLGADTAAKAAPDGYTLLVGQASNLAINQHLMSKLPYDPVRDFAPITLIATSPSLLVVHPSLPVRTIKDLVALAKAKPGTINYASAGSGSPGHLAAEYFKKVTQTDIVHIPYKGATPVGVHLLIADPSASTIVPVERKGRPTVIPNWIVVLEGISIGALDNACDAHLAEEQLRAHGGEAAPARETYSLQIMVAKPRAARV